MYYSVIHVASLWKPFIAILPGNLDCCDAAMAAGMHLNRLIYIINRTYFQRILSVIYIYISL
jgi:hypothetical protein